MASISLRVCLPPPLAQAEGAPWTHRPLLSSQGGAQSPLHVLTACRSKAASAAASPSSPLIRPRRHNAQEAVEASGDVSSASSPQTLNAPPPLLPSCLCPRPDPLPRGARCVAANASRGRRRPAAAVGVEEEEMDEVERRRMEVFNEIVGQVNQEFGKGTMQAWGADSLSDIELFSSGVLPLDVALGGGWPRGRIVEIFGAESSGKTTLALLAAAQIQKEKGFVLMVDAEHAMNPVWARKLGVNLNKRSFHIHQPGCGEEALTVVEKSIRSGEVGLILVDSVSSLVPRAEIEGAVVGEQSFAGLARIMSAGLRQLVPSASKHGCTVMFINQTRQLVSTNPWFSGPRETTSGGNALKFHASVRVKTSSSKGDKTNTFSKVKATVVKSKVWMPYQEAEFDIVYNAGISQEASVFTVAHNFGLVTQSGAWYAIEGQRVQGREGAIQFLQANPDVCSRLEAQAREMMINPSATQGSGPAVEYSDDDVSGLEDEAGELGSGDYPEEF